MEKELGRDDFVTAREISRHYITGKSENVWSVIQTSKADISANAKFNAMVGWNSMVDMELKEYADGVVSTFEDSIYLSLNRNNLDKVSDIKVEREKYEFKNNPGGYVDDYKYSIHPRYSGFNRLEYDCTRAIDRLQLPWCRNPYFAGYGVPIFKNGNTVKFYPDFIIWRSNKKSVVLLEVTSEKYRREKLERKLFSIGSDFFLGGKRKDVPDEVILSIIVRFGDYPDFKYSLYTHKSKKDRSGYIPEIELHDNLEDVARNAVSDV